MAINSHQATRIDIDYSSMELKLKKYLDERNDVIMVLSTSSNNTVLSRSVWIANKGLDLYFFTWAYSRKCLQISTNPNVSLCQDKVEIEGIAGLVGPMFSAETTGILDLFRSKDPDAIKQWECKPSMVIYHISPVFACVDAYKEQDNVFYEYIDFQKRVAWKENWAYK
ncbi:MAG TPA: pyridoxamine 5'-phosphate oxidase family protein [Longilinea sp.]|nr:pyridoxamine 5'-phosphate oxidase family protein [Longilinea sp.]